jgi:hypothetical protein
MEKKGCVSLWLANVADAETLKASMAVNFTEDGDSVPSKFAEAFGIRRCNPDTVETKFVGTKSNISEVLSGFSYCDEIVPDFAEKSVDVAGFNAAVAMYEYRYENDESITAELRELFSEFLTLSDGLRAGYSASLSKNADDWEKKLSENFDEIPKLHSVIYSAVSGTRYDDENESLKDLIPGFRLIHIEEMAGEVETLNEILSQDGREDYKSQGIKFYPLLNNYSSDYGCVMKRSDGSERFAFIPHDELIAVEFHDSTTKFLRTQCEFYKQGAYFLDDDGFFESDPDKEDAIAAKVNADDSLGVGKESSVDGSTFKFVGCARYEHNPLKGMTDVEIYYTAKNFYSDDLTVPENAERQQAAFNRAGQFPRETMESIYIHVVEHIVRQNGGDDTEEGRKCVHDVCRMYLYGVEDRRKILESALKNDNAIFHEHALKAVSALEHFCKSQDKSMQDLRQMSREDLDSAFIDFADKIDDSALRGGVLALVADRERLVKSAAAESRLPLPSISKSEQGD